MRLRLRSSTLSTAVCLENTWRCGLCEHSCHLFICTHSCIITPHAHTCYHHTYGRSSVFTRLHSCIFTHHLAAHSVLSFLILSPSLALSLFPAQMGYSFSWNFCHIVTHTHTHTRRLQYRSSRKEWTRSHDSAWHGSENNSQGTCNILFLATTLSCTF